nr:MAG TPA: hypothetical protein [Caudoviricetes sp.]
MGCAARTVGNLIAMMIATIAHFPRCDDASRKDVDKR